MERDERRGYRVTVWLEEYRARRSEVAHRIELQHKNANLHTVILAAASGYAVTLLAQDGLLEFAKSEMLLLLPVVCAITVAFMVRHLDHEASLIEAAMYVNTHIRPNLRWITGSDVLQWEEFLRNTRRKRIRWFAGTSLLGSDLLVIFATATPFLVTAWLALFYVPGHAGTALVLYNVLLFVDTALILWCLIGNFVSGFGYARITRDGPAKKPLG